ncbi:MAG TPA: lysylphosphatidylglycerol synthase transmembrane domain-containing protein [Polyangiaceae bacterium]|nr:lysylphosphatidylglycerol synthase transmembrane domain-containing protein [Polyangiaceae bacterium]
MKAYAEQAMAAPPEPPTPERRATALRLPRLARGLLALGTGISVAALAAWWLGVRADDVMAHAAGISRWTLAASVASAFVVLSLHALRWHLVMRPLLGLGYSDALFAQLVGAMFNAVLPARGGDLLRVQYLGRRTGKSRATILGTEVVDRWLDWWGWVPVIAVLAATTTLPRWVFGAFALLVVVLAGWAALMVAARLRGWTARPGSRAGATLRAFKAGIDAFESPRTLVLALLVAPLPWIWESGAIAAISRSFDVHLTFATAFCVLVGFNVATVVPSPGALGSVETGGTAALVFFGAPRSNALAFMLVYHLTQLLPAVAAGAAVLVATTNRKLLAFFERVTAFSFASGQSKR